MAYSRTQTTFPFDELWFRRNIYQYPASIRRKGTILIRGEIKNDAEQKASLELEHIIYNPDGSIAQTQKQSIQIKGGELYSFRTETSPILSPDYGHPRLLISTE